MHRSQTRPSAKPRSLGHKMVKKRRFEVYNSQQETSKVEQRINEKGIGHSGK